MKLNICGEIIKFFLTERPTNDLEVVDISSLESTDDENNSSSGDDRSEMKNDILETFTLRKNTFMLTTDSIISSSLSSTVTYFDDLRIDISGKTQLVRSGDGLVLGKRTSFRKRFIYAGKQD